jgi:chemotaxis protein MotB
MRWLLTYADMITLLMLFFIILYSMSSIDTEKYKELSQALASVFTGGSWSILLEGGTTASQGVLEGVQAGKPIIPQRTGKVTGTGGTSAIMTQATSSLQNLIKSGRVRVIPTEMGLAISLVADVNFAPASADLTAASYPALQDVAGFLNQLDNTVVVEGHTDNIPVDTAKYKSNWELSSDRALSVLQALLAYGVPDNRLSIAGYGDTRPVRSNDTAEGRAYNRRVDIVIIEKEQ